MKKTIVKLLRFFVRISVAFIYVFLVIGCIPIIAEKAKKFKENRKRKGFIRTK